MSTGLVLKESKTRPVDPGGLKDIVFDISPDAKTARMIGNAGAEDVAIVKRELSLSFIEITPTGNVVTPTIFSAPRPPYGRLADTYFAVMSRHIALLDRGGVASQLHGTCRALR